MRPSGTGKRLLPDFLLAAILVVAQLGVVAHAFEHDPGTPQAKVCATCVVAGQLDTAAVHSPGLLVLKPGSDAIATALVTAFRSTVTPAARQRGPPYKLPAP